MTRGQGQVPEPEDPCASTLRHSRFARKSPSHDAIFWHGWPRAPALAFLRCHRLDPCARL